MKSETKDCEIEINWRSRIEVTKNRWHTTVTAWRSGGIPWSVCRNRCRV